MSRTAKDKPYKFSNTESISKKKRELDTEYHWMSTPGWWTRLMMNKPQRRSEHLLERKALVSDIDNFDIPDTGKKPHVYYW